MAWAYVTDAASHPPPTAGAYAYYSTYGAFGPDRPGLPGARGRPSSIPCSAAPSGDSRTRSARRRSSDIYAKNGFWNADGTRMLHRGPCDRTIIDTTTGAVVRGDVPGNFDGSFAPDDPDTWYYFDGASLRKFSIATGATSLVKTFSGHAGRARRLDGLDRHLGPLHGAEHRRQRARVGQAETTCSTRAPSAATWDRAGRASRPTASTWWPPATTSARTRSTTATRTVNTTGVMFWSLCGDHGDLVSATDGKTYFVTFECHSDPGVYAVDITIPQTDAAGRRQAARGQHEAARDDRWADDGHISACRAAPSRTGRSSRWNRPTIPSRAASASGGRTSRRS